MASKDNSPLGVIGILIRLGFAMITPILAGAYFGHYLDGRFQSGNLFLIIFTIIGAVIAFRLLLVESSKLSKKE